MQYRFTQTILHSLLKNVLNKHLFRLKKFFFMVNYFHVNRLTYIITKKQDDNTSFMEVKNGNI